jgi:hypothetical protein
MEGYIYTKRTGKYKVQKKVNKWHKQFLVIVPSESAM